MLTEAGCRARQARFLAALDQGGIPGALLTAPRDIYYLTGVLPENKVYPYPNALFLGPGRPSWLITGSGSGSGRPLVDERATYPVGEMATLNPDNHRRICERLAGLAPRERGLSRIGYQEEDLPHSLACAFGAAAGPGEWVPVDGILQTLQLRKDPDEIACIRRAVRATLAGYSRAQQIIRPGVTELEVMTEAQAAAQRTSGEVHFFNGDFQSGTPGGFARDRRVEAGELYIIDAWSDLNGYWCDMSRGWSVGGEPTRDQESVYDHVAAVLRAVPEMARVGRDTRDFWAELDCRLREHPLGREQGLVHHGGHGVGLRVHEPPDLNRDRGGIFEVGNVFTCEPAIYGADLRAGIRLENVFHITEAGVEVLIEYPLSLRLDPACPVPE